MAGSVESQSHRGVLLFPGGTSHFLVRKPQFQLRGRDDLHAPRLRETKERDVDQSIVELHRDCERHLFRPQHYRLRR